MTYRGRNQAEASQRGLDPYALIYRWGWWCVIGHCHLRGAVRSFRVDRIGELILSGETFDIAAGFDIHFSSIHRSVDAPFIRLTHRDFLRPVADSCRPRAYTAGSKA